MEEELVRDVEPEVDDGDAGAEEAPRELSPVERLCVAQAMMSAVGDVVSAKVPGSLRSEVDGEMRRVYEATGAKSYDLKLLGRKVGTYSVRVTKPVDERRLVVEDREAFERWALANDMAHTEQVVVVCDDALPLAAMAGEVPEGCRVVRVREDPHVTGGTVRVDRKAVAEVLGSALPDAVAGFLSAGDGE